MVHFVGPKICLFWAVFWKSAGSEVLTVVVVKSSIFWDITPCSALKVNRRFGGICCPHFRGAKISRARNQHENSNSSACHLLSDWYLAALVLRPWRWRQNIAPKCRFTLNGLYGVISQKTELFKCILYSDLFWLSATWVLQKTNVIQSKICNLIKCSWEPG
jgi:hypothetical protein